MDKIKKIIKLIKKTPIKTLALVGLVFFFILGGAGFLWVSSFDLPDINAFEERKVVQSTKIYDRTGEIVLYDVHGDIKRTVVPISEISDYAKKSTIAVEDANFYNHNGVEFQSILRAVWVNFKNGNLLGGQGGSTITQQVIKNALLTSDKKISRKVKEWVLAPQLEKKLTKEQILEVYLNEIPYGGNVYGIQEASRRFFGKDAKDLTLAESSYLAALPQAPTYYSPYGNNVDALEARKNYALSQMLKNGFITEDEYNSALKEEVTFQKQENFGIRAPHFVIYIREMLEEKYGVEAIEEGGLKVITTLDYTLQEKAEEIVKKYAIQNKETYDAENAALVARDPKTGEILVMVGSRDYFDEEIDGNFNIITAKRQPGSSFKPIVYAEAFNKGYRPETVVFDVSTQFSSTCSSGGNCYSPVNYDDKFRGPMSLRDALAQSINIPAVKMLYLAGLADSLKLARRMGIESLGSADQYGLTLVLGGGEVTPLEMSSAYSVFANDGQKVDTISILKVEDKSGEVLEEFKPEEVKPTRILPEQTARLISDVLSDNIARAPSFGSNSPLNFPGRDVAVKTGTTNDYRDAWIVGYTPNISVAAWAGNNDNRSFKKVAGYVVAPMWNEFIQFAINELPEERFYDPAPIDPNIKPILAGFWKGEETKIIDIKTGEEADENTNSEDRRVVVSGSGGGIHSILHWVSRNNPLGPIPSNPNSDPQYVLWEEAVQKWVNSQNISDQVNVFNKENLESGISITNPEDGKWYNDDIEMFLIVNSKNKLKSGTVFVNNKEIGDLNTNNNSFEFTPSEIEGITDFNEIKVVAEDEFGNSISDSITIEIR